MHQCNYMALEMVIIKLYKLYKVRQNRLSYILDPNLHNNSIKDDRTYISPKFF